MPPHDAPDTQNDPRLPVEVPNTPWALVIAIIVAEALLLGGAVVAFINNLLPIAVFIPLVIALSMASVV